MVKVSRSTNASNASYSLFSRNFCFLSVILFIAPFGLLYLLLRASSVRQISEEEQAIELFRQAHHQDLQMRPLRPLGQALALAVGRPHIIYGTAWKEGRTAELVADAIRSGFRFIDTACQPKHYREDLVGEGWNAAAKELRLGREDVFLQTKFTGVRGQDLMRIPYNPQDTLPKQVATSLAVSLSNLKTNYLDSWVLHSPMETHEETMLVWRTMEENVKGGKVRNLGISNVYDSQALRRLYDEASVKPSFVQNRFRAETAFDKEIRAFCKETGMLYQSFWTLTANRQALATPRIRAMAEEKGLTPQTLMYAFMMSQGHIPLSGTTDLGHMAEDVDVMKRMVDGEDIFEGDLGEFSKILGVIN